MSVKDIREDRIRVLERKINDLHMDLIEVCPFNKSCEVCKRTRGCSIQAKQGDLIEATTLLAELVNLVKLLV
jgi:hypothetical protein